MLRFSFLMKLPTIPQKIKMFSVIGHLNRKRTKDQKTMMRTKQTGGCGELKVIEKGGNGSAMCRWGVVLSSVWMVLLMNVSMALPPLALPTENEAVLDQRPNDYFMYVNRYFEGKSSKPWEAGTYGFVRNMKRTQEGVIGTRFHEGADIKPVRRTSSGVPLDPVVSIAEGVVAYVNGSSYGSNYGKYVAVLHNWGEGPIISLYAHLGKVSCKVGQKVEAGSELGILGYTGVGIDKTRAHLHFEVALMLSDEFDSWHRKFKNSAASHGNFNGRNLSGMNGIELIAMQRRGEVSSVKEYLAQQTPYYAVTVRAEQVETLQKRYPWLWVIPQGEHQYAEISFFGSGLPLKVVPSDRAVTKPTITNLKPFLGRHEDRTLSRLSGAGKKAQLTTSGEQFMALLLGDY